MEDQPVSQRAARVDNALRLADLKGERTAAAIRIAIFAAILVAVVAAEAAGFDHHPLGVTTAVYGLGTIAGLALAWRGLYRPWLPYAFVGFDVVTLSLTILVLGRTLGLSPGASVALPVAGLVVIVLLHASMHYRPGLVLFGATLFVASMLAGNVLLRGDGTDPGLALHDVAEDHLLHFRIFPVAIFALAVGILLITTHRTRRFISDAFDQANRAATLSRHFSPEVAEELTSRSEESASFGERMPVAVLFADMRGFTTMSEAMDPVELARFLSDFRSRLARPVIAQGGVVDKYIGDAIMVVFGAPKPRADDAQRALACAQAMVHAIDAWSEERERQGRPPVAIAIGGHYGNVFAGVLSDGRLLEYTVIGDTVNIASRLARLPRSFNTPLVVSAALVEAAGGLPDAAPWDRLPPQMLPGHPSAVSVFALRLDGQ